MVPSVHSDTKIWHINNKNLQTSALGAGIGTSLKWLGGAQGRLENRSASRLGGIPFKKHNQ
jgi:hypothetical protein